MSQSHQDFTRCSQLSLQYFWSKILCLRWKGSTEDSRHREDKLCQEHCNGINGKLYSSENSWPMATQPPLTIAIENVVHTKRSLVEAHTKSLHQHPFNPPAFVYCEAAIMNYILDPPMIVSTTTSPYRNYAAAAVIRCSWQSKK